MLPSGTLCTAADVMAGLQRHSSSADETARRFPSNQVHLSLSLPPTLTAPSGPSLDPFASKTLLVMEKELGKWLGEVLATEQTASQVAQSPFRGYV